MAIVEHEPVGSGALHLAKQGTKTVLLEQSLLGWGASGRNGGQVHVGMRRNHQHWLETQLGRGPARAHWAVAQRAREHLDWLIETYQIRCDFVPGLLHADHRERYLRESGRYVEFMNTEYGYNSLRVVKREEMRDLVSTDDYVGGTLDLRGGHLHPLNFALGIARAAQSHGAQLYEESEVVEVARGGSGYRVKTRTGTVQASKVILAGNGYLNGLSRSVEAHVMPINNFIAVTEPLADPEQVVRRRYAVSDSRFVIYYFRMTPDGRLLFGGGENYTYRFPADIAAFVKKHIVHVFPQLSGVRIDYAWGGTLAITPNRMPYVRELEPGLLNASGFSGKGVVLAPYVGRILADAVAGRRDEFELLNCLHVPRFPGGRAFRTPTMIAAMSLGSLHDKL